MHAGRLRWQQLWALRRPPVLETPSQASRLVSLFILFMMATYSVHQLNTAVADTLHSLHGCMVLVLKVAPPTHL
jgi:hypothetical protein